MTRGARKIMATYLDRKSYDRFIGKIMVTLKPCTFAGVVTTDQAKIVAGEFWDVWPDSIADDE
jgi:hypothetical protein